MTVYINGCNCGTTGYHLNRVRYYSQLHGNKVDVKNSKYDSDARAEHLQYSSTMQPIVVDNGKVTKLKEWKQ